MSLPDFDFALSLDELRDNSRDVIDSTLRLVDDLEEPDLIGPYSTRLNPFLWEITHSLWFIERWTLREFQNESSRFEDLDELYNSPKIRHGQRWARDLVPLNDVRDFATTLKKRLETNLAASADDRFLYYLAYAIFHSDMHTEALTYQRQTRGLPAPPVVVNRNDTPRENDDRVTGDASLPGGSFPLGAEPSDSFLFDNERWVHDIPLDAFELSKTPVTNEQYRKFVADDGYETPEHWSRDGWQWLRSSGLDSPLYWRKRDGQWLERRFDEWKPLQSEAPVTCVNYYEAEAYCSWAGRRLPTEGEWEMAASGWTPSNQSKRTYPWGNEMAEKAANLDWSRGGPVSVHHFPAGDSPHGLRQMIGNCWEWTQSDFEPFPGYEPDFYRQYSQPWMGSRKVLRGGSWMTRSRLIRNGFRNFFTPDRNDIPAGFRTCAVT